jgi:hypothetical protein
MPTINDVNQQFAGFHANSEPDSKQPLVPHHSKFYLRRNFNYEIRIPNDIAEFLSIEPQLDRDKNKR